MKIHDLARPQLLEAKKLGFSDKQIAKILQRLAKFFSFNFPIECLLELKIKSLNV